MEIEILKLTNLETNCYILSLNGKKIVIDPASPIICNKLDNVVAILVTHYHYDHVGGLLEAQEKYQVNTYDFNTIGKFEVEDFKFEVIRVLGHHDTCVMFKFDNIIFTGDFLFKETVGRTDLETGDYLEMLDSIKLIKTYSEDTIIYPGHGEDTTLKHEFLHNPYLNK